jgi:hypothetical protein
VSILQDFPEKHKTWEKTIGRYLSACRGPQGACAYSVLQAYHMGPPASPLSILWSKKFSHLLESHLIIMRFYVVEEILWNINIAYKYHIHMLLRKQFSGKVDQDCPRPTGKCVWCTIIWPRLPPSPRVKSYQASYMHVMIIYINYWSLLFLNSVLLYIYDIFNWVNYLCMHIGSLVLGSN